MKVIAYNNTNFELINFPVILIAESEITPIQDILNDIPHQNNYVILEEEQVPDRKYMKSWSVQNGQIHIDIIKSRDILRDRLRQIRHRYLSQLDISFQRALETGADTTEIVLEKQKYRDLPEDPRIDECQTTEELDSLWIAMGFDPIDYLIKPQ